MNGHRDSNVLSLLEIVSPNQDSVMLMGSVGKLVYVLPPPNLFRAETEEISSRASTFSEPLN